MNDTQWLFELESMYAREEQRYEEMKVLFKLVKQSLVELLGLNLMPVEDEIPVEGQLNTSALGDEKVFRRLRQPKENEILPLSILLGNPEIVAEIVKRQQELHTQQDIEERQSKGEVVQMTPDELDGFMKEGLAEGDIEFLDDIDQIKQSALVDSPEFKWMHEMFVKPLSEKDEDPIFGGKDEANVKSHQLPKLKRSRVTLE